MAKGMVLEIGRTSAGRIVPLPDDAVTQGFAILARRRSGKSTLAGVMEETLCGRGDPWIALDPAGAHWGIEYLDDNGRPGKPSGRDVLLVGGKFGHVQLVEHSGAALAEIVCDTNISCVIDLKMVSMTARQRFVADFANELFRINETPRHIFLEEAQAWIPQNPRWDEQKAVLYAIERLIKEGGGQGIGFTVITQRPASVSKDVLTQIDNLFVMRMSGPQDIAAAKAWFEHNIGDPQEMKRILDTLPGLVPGEAWLLAPEAPTGERMTRLQIRQRETYHAGRTPKRGDKPVSPRKVELPKVIERFRNAAAQRQIAITEERDLRQQVKTLERELVAAKKAVSTSGAGAVPAPAPAPPSEEVIARRVNAAVAVERKAAESERRAIAGLVSHVGKALPALRSVFDGLEGSVARLGAALEGQTERPYPSPGMSAEMSSPARFAPEATPSRRISRPVSPNGTGDGRDGRDGSDGGDGDDRLTSSARRMLRQLAIHHPRALTRVELGTLAGVSHRKSTFRIARARLTQHGLIEVVGDVLAITEAGLVAAGPDVPMAPTSHADAMALWRNELPTSAFRMLEVLVQAGPAGLSQDELAEQSGINRELSTFRILRARLKYNGLIDIISGQVRASAVLLPEWSA